MQSRSLFSHLNTGRVALAIGLSVLVFFLSPVARILDSGEFGQGSFAQVDTKKIGVLYDAAAGPWGNLQYYYFHLEAPSHLIEVYPLKNPRTRWIVPTREEGNFRALLGTLPLSAAQKAGLLNENNIAIGDGIFALFPPADILVSLDVNSRATIYNYLNRFNLNPDIDEPVRIFSGSVDEWAKGSGMRAELVDQMRRMTYQRNGLMLFSDFPHIISQANSYAEARDLQKQSSRVRSMMVKLDLRKMSHVDEIMDYWTTGLGLRRKDIASLIQAGMETPGVDGLDLVHLLPVLPRKLLYTYPDMSMAIQGTLPDCHWTSLNFFSYDAQPFYLEERFATISLLGRFEQITPPYKFGDVLVFVTPEMNAHHSCVYIAADIVYTKNGRSLYAPWTMLHLSDVEKLYFDYEGVPLRVQGFRRKLEE